MQNNRLIHLEYIEAKLKEEIDKKGILQVGLNLNEYITFEDANTYALSRFKEQIHNKTKDFARQEKSSKDSTLGRLVEETIVFLLKKYFDINKFNYYVTNNKKENDIIEYIVNSLVLEKKNQNISKKFDSDILIYNIDNFNYEKKVFIISAKGTTRERIGQFLSHLFLMDQDVLNAKYGKNRYEVIFTKENIKVKYAFVTFDWAKNKDFIEKKSSSTQKINTKKAEVQLILDDVKYGGGIYVLNNLKNIDGIGNFAGLVGKICDFLK